MPQAPTEPPDCRRFDFERDTFAFANELVCEYVFDPGGGRPRMIPRWPRPTYAHRCFVLTRAVRQFHYHAEFEPGLPAVGESEYRRRVRLVTSRSPRAPCAPEARVGFPAFSGLRTLSEHWTGLLKEECGGAWRSYFQRSHWRMILPISRRHQLETARSLQQQAARGGTAVVHLVRFPQLTINHSVVVYGCRASGSEVSFLAYDPNYPERPAVLTYDCASSSFAMPTNRYWPGGVLDVIEIYRGALM